MKKLLKLVTILLLAVLLVFGLTNWLILNQTKSKIVSPEQIKRHYQAILILGAGVRGDQPSPILEDRLLTGIELYQQGAAKKIIMSGDHYQRSYNEVQTMKNFAIAHGVPSEDIFMDHAGLSTYASIARASRVFGLENMIVVSQRYHLPRALFLAERFEIESVGVAANRRDYFNQTWRDWREFLARTKDYFLGSFKIGSYIDGSPISVEDSGSVTDD